MGGKAEGGDCDEARTDFGNEVLHPEQELPHLRLNSCGWKWKRGACVHSETGPAYLRQIFELAEPMQEMYRVMHLKIAMLELGFASFIGIYIRALHRRSRNVKYGQNRVEISVWSSKSPKKV